MSGRRPRGRPRISWMNGVKEALKGMKPMDEIKRMTMNRNEWKSLLEKRMGTQPGGDG